ncbi:hypothetical protein [Mucilaginibacter gracilis]|uniref:hypothetical protein n=1 Tax=Mucilaginibacter gracilis TaxID=423350 RepID=UPI0011C398B2|nr:hypothetical protein [Mucilaginibacter gracilis]
MNNYNYKNRSKFYAYFIAAILCCSSLLAHAQRQEFVLKGVAFKDGTTQRLARVLVANLTDGGITTTDELGTFQLKCALGDSLLFRQKDFSDKKIAVNTQNTVMVYMQANISLSEVNIKGLNKRQELQQVMNEYNSQGIYNKGKPSVASAILNPLNGLYDLFGSGPKQARHFKQFAEHDLQQTEVNRRFTKNLVQRITGLQDSAKVQTFILAYKPSYEDIKAWNDYDLINYVKRSFTDFEKNGEQPPPALPSLTAPQAKPVKKEN